MRAVGNGRTIPTEDDLETRLFLQALEGRFGVDFLAFDPASMQRKLARHVAATGAASVSALQGRVLRDPALGTQVIRMLGGRDLPASGDVFRVMALRCSLLPILRSSPWPAIWLADCDDVDALLLLLALLRDEGLVARTRVFVTCHAEPLLEALQAWTLSVDEVAALQARHIGSGGRTGIADGLHRAGDRFVLDPALRASISWHVHNLATDASFGEFQAVLALRPLREYGKAMRAQAASVFGKSLCPFGILQMDDMLAARGALPSHRFSAVLPSYGIYRKLG